MKLSTDLSESEINHLTGNVWFYLLWPLNLRDLELKHYASNEHN